MDLRNDVFCFSRILAHKEIYGASARIFLHHAFFVCVNKLQARVGNNVVMHSRVQKFIYTYILVACVVIFVTAVFVFHGRYSSFF